MVVLNIPEIDGMSERCASNWESVAASSILHIETHKSESGRLARYITDPVNAFPCKYLS